MRRTERARRESGRMGGATRRPTATLVAVPTGFAGLVTLTSRAHAGGLAREGSLPVASSPYAVAYDPANHDVYVGAYPNLSLISSIPHRPVATLAAFPGSITGLVSGLAYDPLDRDRVAVG